MKRLIAAGAIVLVSASCGSAGSDSDSAPEPSSPEATTRTTVVVTRATEPPTTLPATTTTTTSTVAASTTAAPSEGELDLPETSHFAIVNATLITATGAEPVADGVVLIRDGMIEAVGQSDDVAIPADAELVDVAGGHVLPGLVDTHTHNLNMLNLVGAEFDRLSPNIYLNSPLRTGLTTFRDTGSRFGKDALFVDLQAAIDTYDEPTPTVVATGPIILRADSEGHRMFPDQAIGVSGPDEAAATTIELLDRGVDQIKIFIDTEFRGVETASLDAAEVAAITAAAHERGYWVLAHVSSIEEARLGVVNGVDELTHWPGEERLPDELIEAIVAGGIPIGSTFSIITPYEDDVRRFLDAGGTIVLSTDAPGAASPVGTWRELERMVAAGMTAMEAIIASTRDASVVVGLGDQVGTLEVGKRADILVLGGDPLANVAALGDVCLVVKDGVVATP